MPECRCTGAVGGGSGGGSLLITVPRGTTSIPGIAPSTPNALGTTPRPASTLNVSGAMRSGTSIGAMSRDVTGPRACEDDGVCIGTSAIFTGVTSWYASIDARIDGNVPGETIDHVAAAVITAA